VKILDFGLAKLAGQTRLTRTGMTVGTVAYMSPEQTRNNESAPGTDIWSLGVVLCEMLTARLPFKGDYDQAAIYSILNEQPRMEEPLKPSLPPPSPYCRSAIRSNGFLLVCCRDGIAINDRSVSTVPPGTQEATVNKA
jgi:serine/threonine protein kinase